jgi:hypothetical protein
LARGHAGGSRAGAVHAPKALRTNRRGVGGRATLSATFTSADYYARRSARLARHPVRATTKHEEIALGTKALAAQCLQAGAARTAVAVDSASVATLGRAMAITLLHRSPAPPTAPAARPAGEGLGALSDARATGGLLRSWSQRESHRRPLRLRLCLRRDRCNGLLLRLSGSNSSWQRPRDRAR